MLPEYQSGISGISKDLLTSCGYASDRIEKQAKDAVEWLVKLYNDELKNVIADKINQIEKADS